MSNHDLTRAISNFLGLTGSLLNENGANVRVDKRLRMRGNRDWKLAFEDGVLLIMIHD
jgi:hypothetical protein